MVGVCSVRLSNRKQKTDMAKHEFGGEWTAEKLERLQKYLCAYTVIFKKNPRAQYFTTIYVDAFAGAGHRSDRPKPGATDDVLGHVGDPEVESFKKGSARIALEVEPPFDRFIFIERAAARVKELEALRKQFPTKADDVQIQQGDANSFLLGWCRETNWRKYRAVVFLDPYGMQADWETIKALAETKAIDMWLLFPLGMAVNRLLPRAGPPDKPWHDALTRIFGTEDWLAAFYPKVQKETLWGPETTQRKQAPLDDIARFFEDRLRTVFAGVAPNPLRLTNSTGMPIYLFCFAAGNPKGATTAVRIARHILET